MKQLFFLTLFFSHSLAATWHDRKCEGWAYFEQPNLGEDSDKEPIEPPLHSLLEAKKEMEETFAAAVLEPTEQNVLDYLTLQQHWLTKAGSLAHTWSKVVIENPHLNNAFTGMPTSNYGLKFYHKQKSLSQKQTIQTLAKTHALLCFYEGKKEASKEFAQVIKIFSQKYDWLAQPLSVDGVSIKQFPHTAQDKGLQEYLGVEHFPALYLFDPQTEAAKPIGFGLLSVDMIERNIALQCSEEIDQYTN